MKQAIFYLLLLPYTSNVYAQKTDYLINPYVPIWESDSLEKKEAMNIWAKYLQSKDSTDDNSKYWNQKDINRYGYVSEFYVRQLGKSTLYNSNTYYKPSILHIKKIADSTYILKTAFTHNESDGFAKIVHIVNVMAIPEGGEFKLKSMLDYNLEILSYQQKKVGSITFFYRKNHVFNAKLAQKFDSLNTATAIQFGVEKPISFQYYLLEDSKELYQLQGYDFHYYTVNISKNDGMTLYGKSPMIYSTNNKEYFHHELIHLYVSQKFNTFGGFFEEGIASFLGDCGYQPELPFTDHLKNVATYVKNNSNYSFADLSNLKIIDGKTNMPYFTAALFCKVMNEREGLLGIFRLLDNPNGDDPYTVIEKVIRIKKENIDTFIKQELKKYE
jgi:hypothetical protein